VDPELAREKMEQKHATQRHYYNQGARELKPLANGEEVHIQTKSGKWKAVTGLGQHNTPRSCTVRTKDGSENRRNRRQFLACVAWRFLRGETALTNPKVAMSLGVRQLRNRLQGWRAFFVSPVRWHTGHFHWIRRITHQSKGHLQGTAMITLQIFGTQVGNRS